jgi:hypothetical protein
MNINMTSALLRVFLTHPRTPGSGHSPIDQATAPARPSFLNINIIMKTAGTSVFYYNSRLPRSGSSTIFHAPGLAQPSFLT